MGEQSSTPDAPPSRDAAKKKRQRQDQEAAMLRLAEAEDDMEKASATQIDESNEDAVANQRAVGRRASGFYVRSSSGNMVRSATSGNVVLSRAGRQAQENIRAGYDGRDARNMDKEFPMDTGGDDQPMQMSGQSKIEPKKTVKGPSAATRRLLAQGQMAQKTRQFY